MTIGDGLGDGFVTGVKGFFILKVLFVLKGLLVFFVGVNSPLSAAPRMNVGSTEILAFLKIDFIFL